MQPSLITRRLGVTDFEATWHAMQTFTTDRLANTPDELWLTEHQPVYTLGLNRKQVRLPSDTNIPLVLTDRGGKITYHGPGQIIIYALLDLNRNHLNIRSLVTHLEKSIITLLANYGVSATAKQEAPGVYIRGADGIDAKIASLGLRIKNNCCYHGLSLNVNMDLKPFTAIDPCGYIGLKVTQTSDLGINDSQEKIAESLLSVLTTNLANGNMHD
ncbi:MAG: lipoyl(octanoyl) transferase LipB [Bacteroidia bacterium]|nr:lipoyl(octanoyl) transferase LipB [Methylotenera sp.]